MNYFSNRNPLAIGCLLLGSALAQADVLELKNGQILNGKYEGGTAATVRFQTSKGLEVIETSRIVALTFTTTRAGRPAPSAAGSAPASSAAVSVSPASAATVAAAPPAQPRKVALPAGTTLLVRMMSSVSSQNPPGTRFATKLEYNLEAGGLAAVKAGTTIHGEVKSSTRARRVAGRPSLDIRLTQMVINGKPVPIVTSGYAEAGERGVRDAARGAAGGAAIGAIAGDAGTGAAIGATAGALRRGQDITIPPGAMLEFRLSAPVTLPAGS
jgi:hypothetical protein